MKRALLLGTLCVVVGAYLAWRSQAPSSVPDVISSSPSQEAASARLVSGTVTHPSAPMIAPIAEPVASPVAESVVKKSVPREALPPDGNVVEFEIVRGWAVAYGDVLLGKPQDNGTGQTPPRRGRTEIPAPRLWPTPEIPYAISKDLPQPERVHQALQYFADHTPVRFVPVEKLQGVQDALVFEVGEEHCYSYLGRVGGFQPIHLSGACKWGEIVHELMHALGFIHEHSRLDRDQYVRVRWDNIDEKHRLQFSMAPETFMETSRATDFDYQSVMLYAPNSFARDPAQPTLEATAPGHQILPMRDGLSAGDIKRLIRLYRPNEYHD